MRVLAAVALGVLCGLLGVSGGGVSARSTPSPAEGAPAPLTTMPAAVEPGVSASTSASAPVPDGPATLLDDLPPGAVEIAFVGDVNLGARIGEAVRIRGADHPWSAVAPILGAADLAVINLECAISDRGQALDKEFTFRGDPSSLVGARRAGVDIASVANNHAVDFGRDAFLDTLHHLRRTGIRPVGGGADRTEAYQPQIVSSGGVRLGFVAATRVMPHGFAATDTLPGVASAYDEASLLAAVKEAARNSDVVVVLLHWGTETHTAQNPVQVGLARALVAEGADVVVGHHPHRLQPVERMDGAVVAYSMGNFVFTSPSAGGRESAILRVGVMPDRSLVTAWTPVRIDPDGRPVPVDRTVGTGPSSDRPLATASR